VGYSSGEKLRECSTCRQKIDPGMLAKSFVFGAERCGDGIWRNVAQRAPRTVDTLVLQNSAQRSTSAIHKFDALRR